MLQAAVALLVLGCEPREDAPVRSPGVETTYTNATDSASHPAADSGVQAIAAVLEQLLFSQAAPPELPPDHWSLLRRLYDGRRYEPLWSGPAAVTGSADARHALLCRTERAGIPLPSLAGEGIPPAAPERVAADSLAWRDLRLTSALLQALESYARGRLDPAALGVPWRVAAPAPRNDSALIDYVLKPDTVRLAALRPTASQYRLLSDALAHLMQVQLRGGWPELKDSVALQLGVRNAAVSRLRQRLVASGDLVPAESVGTRYTSTVAHGVRRFQLRMGLEPDGRVGAATIDALKISAGEQAHRVAANLERYRWLPRTPTGQAIVFDIGSSQAQVWRAGAPVFSAELRVTRACDKELPPVLADTVSGISGDANRLTLQLSGAAAITIERIRRGRQGSAGACLQMPNPAALRRVLQSDTTGGELSATEWYLIYPTTLWRDSMLVVRPDTADAPLLSALPPPTAVCAPASAQRRP